MTQRIDKDFCRRLRDELDSALSGLGEKLGVKFRAGNMTYTDANVTVKLEACLINASGEIETREAQAWKQFAKYYGVPEDALGKTYVLRGEVFKVTGLATKSRKYPVLVERADGARMKYPADFFKLATLKQ